MDPKDLHRAIADSVLSHLPSCWANNEHGQAVFHSWGKAVMVARGGFVRGMERFRLLRQHDRRESIIATSERGIIQDDLLPTPE
jgi:hypothetical protein